MRKNAFFLAIAPFLLLWLAYALSDGMPIREMSTDELIFLGSMLAIAGGAIGIMLVIANKLIEKKGP